nr:tetratricopeptide repeat protein [Pyrinomonadaceae bacterium]
ILAFLIFTFTFNTFAQDETKVSKTWVVQKYDLAVTLPTAENDRNINVKANLDLKNAGTTPATRLTLRIAPNAEVSAARVNGATADFTKGEEKIGSGTLQRIILRLPSIAPNAVTAVSIDYKLNVKENSGLNAISPVGSQFLPLSFWYPTPNSWYFGRGGDFAPTKIQVNAVNGNTTIASGIEANGSFDTKINVQPFFLTGSWDTANVNGVSIYMPKGADAEAQKRGAELANLAVEAKTFAANLLGSFSDSPLRIVAVRRGGGFSLGGAILLDESVFNRQKLDAQSVLNVAEAIAKIKLGNEIQTVGDGYGVIREGLARYVATQFIESKYGKDIADMERLRQRTAYAAVVKRDSPLNTVSPLDDYYYTSNANKGAMIWRVLAKRVGQNEVFNIIKENSKDGNLELTEIRAAFAGQKEFLDAEIDQLTEMDLLVGLPRIEGTDTKIALRNTGSFDATVNISATTVSGKILNAQSTVPAKNFGEVVFKTSEKIVRAEIDSDKYYPQTDYANDIAPKIIDESDALLYVKRVFDKQDFAAAEKNARTVLQTNPLNDDVRILLARSLFQQNKVAEAEKEFRTVLDEKLPTARSLAWANLGLGEISAKSGQNANTIKYLDDAIKANSEYGASLAARQARNKLNVSSTIEEGIKNYFTQFDKTAVSNRKTEVEAIVLSGEVSKFVAGLSGQTEQWQTQIVRVDKIDANNVWVETNLNIKLLNRDPESGTAIYRLTRAGNNWKISGVEIFEVR